MSVTRVPQFPESVIRRGAANARGDLDVYSTTQVDVAISAATAGIDLSAYTLLSTTASISGALNSDINLVEMDVNNLETTVQDISGALTIDIENLDLSLTEAVFNHIEPDGTSPSVSGSFYAWGRIDAISGGPLYVQLFR